MDQPTKAHQGQNTITLSLSQAESLFQEGYERALQDSRNHGMLSASEYKELALARENATVQGAKAFFYRHRRST